MEAEDSSTCYVCFVRPLKLLDYSKIFQCTHCHMTCHRSCYNPSLIGDKFLCDVCAQGRNRTEPCFICGNPGLLKKVQDKFAHPICLLFSPMIIVTRYKSLQFSILREQSKKDKKTICSICKNPGHLERCFAKCNNQAHIYCAWKDYNKAQTNDQQAGWNHNPVVNDLDYKFFFEKKAREYLSFNNPNLVCYFKPLSKAKNKIRQFELVCPDHNQSMFECCMDKKYFRKNENDPPIEYAQCQQCLRWYHQQCLDKQSFQKIIKLQKLICLPCQNFHRLLAKVRQSQKSSLKQQLQSQQPSFEIHLKELPRLNICEIVYFQCLFEEKKYILSPKELELMFRLPIQPSLVFLESTLRNNILYKLKTYEFEQFCNMKLELRMKKKEFKAKFTKNIEKALEFLVEKKNIFQKVEDEESSEDQQKSEQILDQEERHKLKIWIQLLIDFKQKYQDFDKIVTKLVGKMRHWLKTLTDEFIKQLEQSSENEDNRQQSEFPKIEEQKLSTQKQEPFSEPYVKSQQNEEVEQQQIMDVSQYQKNNKIQQSENQSNTVNVLEQEEAFNKKGIPFLDRKTQKQLLNCIKIVKIKANSNPISVDRVYDDLAKEQKNKTFTFDIILNPNFSGHSTLKLLILEVLFQNFLKIQQNLNLTLNESQISYSSSQIILNKDFVKQKNHTSIKYLELYIQKLKDIYDEGSIQVQKQFKFKIQYLIGTVTDLITKFQNQNHKLQNKLNFQEVLNEYQKNPNEKNHLIKRLKSQVGSSFDLNELVVIRIQMEKIEVYKRIKKIKFTNDCHIKIMDQYNDHCRSSSQIMQKETSQNQDQNKLNLRKEIMTIQQQSLRIWLDMYGSIFNLANEFIKLEKTVNLINQLENGCIKQFISRNKEPLEIIEQTLSIDFSTKQQDYKIQVFLHCLAFFSRLQKAKINYKIFHQGLISIIQNLGQFSIMISFEKIQFWATKEDNFKTVKTLYKNFRNLDFLNQNSEVKDLFTKICEIFQTDEAFESYLEKNQERIFDDPQFTHQLFIQKLPQMIKFYNEIGFVNRVHQLRTISIWIACYFRTLKEVGFEIIFGDEFKDSQVKKKYQTREKITFNKINELVALLQKAKLPNSSSFIKKVIKLYKEAESIEIHVQKFFAKSNTFLEKSMELKKQFLQSKSIDKHCFEYSEEYYKQLMPVSSKEFEILIEKLSNNSISDIVTWEYEKRVIQNQRTDFLQLTEQIQYVLVQSDPKIPIRDLNQMFFEVISYPFQYENVSLLYLYIRQCVQKSNILNLHWNSISKKRKQKVDNVEMIYRNLLNSLDLKEKTHFQNRLTRDQIIEKFNVAEQLPELNQIIAHPILKQMRQKILDQVEDFDEIKEACEVIVLKINQNKVLTAKQILSLSESLSKYKQQRVFQLGLELMYSQVQIYKLIFSPIPEKLLDMQVLLEQLRSLKPSFKTAEILKKMKDIEVQISAKQGK